MEESRIQEMAGRMYKAIECRMNVPSSFREFSRQDEISQLAADLAFAGIMRYVESGDRSMLEKE
jgi:hypothetical protein